MTDKIFSMPVRVNDFIANTVHLSNENMGIYWRLLCFSWENKAKLTSNLEEIYEICKAYDEKTKKKVDNVIVKFFNFNEISKCFEQKAQVEEWERVTGISELRSNAGKLGGRPKANGNQKESKEKALILKPKLKLNKKEYTEEFENIWKDLTVRPGSKLKAFTGFQKLTEEDKKKVVSKYNFKISTINDPKYYPHVSSWINGDGINEEIQIGEQQIRKLHNLGSDHKYNGFIDGKHQFLYDMGFAKDLIYYDNKGEKIEKT
tara:strand:+ start:633 stop:1415 length:783 start_codon:yes stop_codon:yes gene_type:complete